MGWIDNNRGNIILAVLLIVLGSFAGVAIYGWHYDAEAVIGGQGNLGSASGHKHNFSSGSGGVEASSEEEICIFCHTPHNAIPEAASGSSILNAPLWNHSLSTESYSVKTPARIGNIVNSSGGPLGGVGFVNQTATPLSQPDGASRLCLSCHDGTVAIGSTRSRGVIGMDTSHSCLDSEGRLTTGTAYCNSILLEPSTGLLEKHVVSVPMNDALISNVNSNCGDAGQTTGMQYPWVGSNNVLLRPTTATYGSSGIDKSQLSSAGCDATCQKKYNTGYAYGVQCTTCHDPHMWSGTGGSEGYKFLVTSGTDQYDQINKLCEACHVNPGC